MRGSQTTQQRQTEAEGRLCDVATHSDTPQSSRRDCGSATAILNELQRGGDSARRFSALDEATQQEGENGHMAK